MADKVLVHSNTKQRGIKTDSKTVYPDLFVVEKGYVTKIYEVETKSTINESSIKQWKTYSKLTSKFYLVVPGKSLELTKELVTTHNITVDGYYTWV